MRTYSQDLEAKISGRRELLSLLQKRKKTLETEIENSKETIQLYEEALSLAKRCLQEGVTKKHYIEDIVSSGMSETYNTTYEFRFETTEEHGAVKNLKPKLKAGEGEFRDPLDFFGGGAVSVISLLLRLSALVLTPEVPKVAIVDEPVANLTPLYWRRLLSFIEGFCEEVGVQLIMITHAEPGGKVFLVSKSSSGVSEVKESNEEEWVNVRREYAKL